MSLPIELHYQIARLALEDANSSSSNILPLLLVHPVWTAFLLPRVYARPRVTARTLASFIAALAHRPDRLRIPQALVWTGPVGGVSGLLASLLDTLSEQLETIEMRRVAVEGLEGATSLWAVLAAMNPVRADIEVIVLEAVKGRNDEEAAVDHHIPGKPSPESPLPPSSAVSDIDEQPSTDRRMRPSP